ncbi:uncharacterized protein MELLADRAFT_91258 [Melampsora larici-populina 98AG31]|uniref:GCM domain-containing protein n=1 Tax=Melampsora larici-populina (strain 98AG31 / pathotype 3-4-7) TaxID=747676 RepID=F4RYE2_MELLP|nr:uncharacterized protein MELLADRAFT_91258 [Melampsora larici-populina 98AG31]EGG02591.1 hypothetical protein MELLADRAFT_91258 [Melampsora larici-populina 98AG31]
MSQAQSLECAQALLINDMPDTTARGNVAPSHSNNYHTLSIHSSLSDIPSTKTFESPSLKDTEAPSSTPTNTLYSSSPSSFCPSELLPMKMADNDTFSGSSDDKHPKSKKKHQNREHDSDSNSFQKESKSKKKHRVHDHQEKNQFPEETDRKNKSKSKKKKSKSKSTRDEVSDMPPSDQAHSSLGKASNTKKKRRYEETMETYSSNQIPSKSSARSSKPKAKKNKVKQPRQRDSDLSDGFESDLQLQTVSCYAQLQLPTNLDRFETFIDKGCILDEQDYPTYPNSNTVFVLKPEDNITNFHFVGWTHTMKVDTLHKPQWIIHQYNCLGVMQCSEAGCRLARSPPTGHKKIEEELNVCTPCPIKECKGIQVHVPCNAQCQFDFEEGGWTLLQHQGYHRHVWPDAKKADPIAKDKLKEMVLNDPKRGPTGMKVGQGNIGTHPIKSVTDLHPSFGHTDLLGYLRRDILTTAGLIDDKQDKEGADKWMTSLGHWAKHGLRLPSSSLMRENRHISFQSPWMEEVLLYKDKSGESYEGGLLSDVTYKFFQHGYLLSTSMYNSRIERWVPVLLTWLAGLETGHYKVHFVTLFNLINNKAKTDQQKKRLLDQVVDFSLAQKNGFIEAYMEVFRVSYKVALSHLHGCEQHYMQAITRIKKNHLIVRPDQEGAWVSMCKGLLLHDEPGKADLETKFCKLHAKFPRAKRWIDWWKMANIQAMLFPARKRIPQDDPPLPHKDSDDEDFEFDGAKRKGRQSKLPKTTNGQESMHQVYYMLCDVP